jgi:2-iminobutanoate/2-iminopropanoate deaminase
MAKIMIPHPDKVDENFTTGSYSPAIVMDGWVFVSGQGPVDFAKGEFVFGTIEEETHLAMHNVKRVLEAAGCTFDDVVKCTVHLGDINDFDVYNAIYASYFDGIKPARTTVQSVLPKGIKVEIDCIARLKTS